MLITAASCALKSARGGSIMSAMGKQCVREITVGFGASAGESREGDGTIISAHILCQKPE